MGLRRKEFLALFQTQISVDPYTGKESRKAVYIGPVYRVHMERFEAKRTGRRILAIWIAALTVYVLAGMTNAGSSRCFYVFPFYAAALFPLFYWGMGTLRVVRLKERVTEVDRDAGPERLHRSALGFAAIAGLHTAADVVFLALGGAGERLTAEMTTLLGVALAGVGALGTLKLLKPLEDALEKE